MEVGRRWAESGQRVYISKWFGWRGVWPRDSCGNHAGSSSSSSSSSSSRSKRGLKRRASRDAHVRKLGWVNLSASLWSSSMYSRNRQRSGSWTGLLQVLNVSRVLPVAARRSSMNGRKSLFPAMFALTLCPQRISGIGGGGGVGAAEMRAHPVKRCRSNAEGGDDG